LLPLVLISNVAVAEYSHTHVPSKSLSVQQGDLTLWSYQFAHDVGVPYFHPVATPDNQVLTNFSPADHPWHRGIWFSWKFLNGVNYWEWKDRNTPVLEGETQTVGKEVVEKVGSDLSITTQLQYSHHGELVLKEQRQIIVSSPRPDGSYVMDWRMTFTAAEQEVVLQRTPPHEQPWGGYGGLSYRASGKLVEQHRFINSEGQRGKEGHGKPARWMDFSGRLPSGELAGVAMFDHPDNPRHPTPWYVAPEMGYFNPALLFHKPYTLPAGKSLTLGYRILVHSRQVDSAALEQEYKAFTVRARPSINKSVE
jgi:hypothetical protein